MNATPLESRYRDVLVVLEQNFGERLKTVVLFGSQARGEVREGSDHDLFVVIEGLPRDPLARQRMVRLTLLPVLDRLPEAIAFIAKTPDEFAANLTPLLLDVCMDGICLWGEAYFEPYRQRALNALDEAGLRREVDGESLTWSFPELPKRNWELTWEGYREYGG